VQSASGLRVDLLEKATSGQEGQARERAWEDCGLWRDPDARRNRAGGDAAGTGWNGCNDQDEGNGFFWHGEKF
jgi:hypothetical protein